MEIRTSELTYNDVDCKTELYNIEYYKDTYTLIYEPGFTEHLHAAYTRYNPAFYHYLTDSIIGVSLAHYGEYTESELGLLRNFLNSECVVYDIGANIGVHTVAFAKGTKHVYAFEPNELNYKLLKINTAHDKNVTTIDYAVSNDIGMTMVEEFKLGTMGNYGECKIVDDGQICPMTTIDRLVDMRIIQPPSLIKIDVEGHEWPVIQGASDTIKNNLPIIFYEAMTADLVSIYDFLTTYAYKLYWLAVPNYNPNNFYNNKNNIFGNGGVLNILALPFHINIETNMLEVIDRNDTYAKAIERYQAKNATKN